MPLHGRCYSTMLLCMHPRLGQSNQLERTLSRYHCHQKFQNERVSASAERLAKFSVEVQDTEKVASNDGLVQSIVPCAHSNPFRLS